MPSKFCFRFGNHQTGVVLIAYILIKIQLADSYLDVNQYCKAFDESFRPIICLLKNGTNTPPANYNPPSPPPPTHYPILYPPPPDYTDYEHYEDDDCSCEVTCVPRIINQRSVLNFVRGQVHKRSKRTPSTSYRCRSCGAECPVSTTRPPTCSCVVPTAKAECTCSATCAMFRYEPYHDFDDDANCILSVTALEDWRLGEERLPYSCECQRSKEFENTNKPDFICVCQRVSDSD